MNNCYILYKKHTNSKRTFNFSSQSTPTKIKYNFLYSVNQNINLHLN